MPISIHKSNLHNRTVIFRGLPQNHPSDLAELTIELRYPTQSSCGEGAKGIALDSHVIPAIHTAFERSALIAEAESALLSASAYLCTPRSKFKSNRTAAEKTIRDTLQKFKQLPDTTQV